MEKLHEKWKEIVRITEDQHGILQGLRNTMFLDLEEAKYSLVDEIKYLLRISVLIFAPTKKSVSINERKYCIIIPSDSPAIYGNIKPIVEKVDKKDLLLIIDNRIKRELQSSYPAINIKEIYRYSKFIFRLKKLLLLARLSLKLKEEIRSSKILNSEKNLLRYNSIKYSYLNFLIILTIEGAAKLLFNIKPQCIISTCDYFPLEYSIFITGRILKIKTFLIQHGIIGLSYIPFTADYMFVWNDYFKNELLSKDLSIEGRIFISGSPGFEYHSEFKKIKSEPNSKKKFIILSDTQGKVVYPETYYAFKQFLNSLSLSDHYEWIVKLHPAEDRSFYDEFVNRGILKILPKEVSLHDALKDCTAAFTIWSTAGIDAILMQIPVIVLDITSEVKKYAWWPNDGGGIYYSSLNSFDQLLESSFTKELMKQEEKFVLRHLNSKNNPSKKIIQIINEVIS